MGASGTATLDFGAFPGKSDASVAVTGQTGILAGSLVGAWLQPAATADHTADEHLVETLKIVAGSIVPGVGFTIYALNTSQLNEPVGQETESAKFVTAAAAQPGTARTQARSSRGGQGTRIYGQWNVAWAWV